MKFIFSGNSDKGPYLEMHTFKVPNYDLSPHFCLWYYCLGSKLKCLPFKSLFWKALTSCPLYINRELVNQALPLIPMDISGCFHFPDFVISFSWIISCLLLSCSPDPIRFCSNHISSTQSSFWYTKNFLFFKK